MAHERFVNSVERLLIVFPAAYAGLILDVILGDHSLFLRIDEVESAWRVVDPVIKRADDGTVRFEVSDTGSGIAVQDRMAFQGEYFIHRYGATNAQRTPPIRRMLELGIPVGAGTDATRVASYNPFVSLYWLITGKTVGGTPLYPEDNRLDRTEALRLYTVGSSWFSAEDGKKGSIVQGQLADLSVLSADFFSIPDEQIKHLESVLTIVGGRIVYAEDEFKPLGPLPLPVSDVVRCVRRESMDWIACDAPSVSVVVRWVRRESID